MDVVIRAKSLGQVVSIRLASKGVRCLYTEGFPKRGFKSIKSLFTQQIRLGDIDRLGISTVNLTELKKCGAVSSLTRNVKIFLSGSIKKPIKVQDIPVSSGVKIAIEKAGGSIESTKEKESK